LHLENRAAAISLRPFMRFIPACLSLIALGGTSLLATTANEALQQLSADQARNLAMIAARDGTPDPERWHLLIFDPKSETGVREIVVASGVVTANRTLSQFAHALTANDVFGADAVKADSRVLAKTAMQYGAANKVTVTSMHYDLRKGGPDGAVWTLTCMDSTGKEVGSVVISALRGTVIQHPGFAQEPSADGALAANKNNPQPVGDEDARPVKNRPSQPPQPKRRPATPPPTPKGTFFQRVFGPH
jgi:hypothetical protein